MEADGALVRAAGAGDVGAVRQLMRSGAPADAADAQARRALAAAAAHGHVGVVELLLASGVAPHAGGGAPQPVHHAVAGGHAAVVELLLAAGAPVDAPCNAGSSNDRWLGNGAWLLDSNGSTPLHIAACLGHLCIVVL
jgi:ankyrin repeat protein